MNFVQSKHNIPHTLPTNLIERVTYLAWAVSKNREPMFLIYIFFWEYGTEVKNHWDKFYEDSSRFDNPASFQEINQYKNQSHREDKKGAVDWNTTKVQSPMSSYEAGNTLPKLSIYGSVSIHYKIGMWVFNTLVRLSKYQRKDCYTATLYWS